MKLQELVQLADALDNALVRQKNEIVKMIDDFSLHGLTAAYTSLRLVEDMWREMSYGYKGRELCFRALNVIERSVNPDMEVFRDRFVELMEKFS